MPHALTGRSVPALTLSATNGLDIALPDLRGRHVLYIYPRTSPPDGRAAPGWADIPGAKGCTPQSCGFRDHFAELTAAGAAGVYGISTQSTVYQQEVVERLHLPYPLLSDADLKLRDALELPCFKAAGMTLLHRLALIIAGGRIEHVFDNISDPAGNAAMVLDYLNSQ